MGNDMQYEKGSLFLLQYVHVYLRPCVVYSVQYVLVCITVYGLGYSCGGDRPL